MLYIKLYRTFEMLLMDLGMMQYSLRATSIGLVCWLCCELVVIQSHLLQRGLYCQSIEHRIGYYLRYFKPSLFLFHQVLVKYHVEYIRRYYHMKLVVLNADYIVALIVLGD